MPNHLTSVCTVTGPEESISAFVARTIVAKEDEHDFDFNAIIRAPDIVKETESGSLADIGFFALTGMVEYRFACLLPNPYQHYTKRGFQVGTLTTPENFRAWLEQNEPETLKKGAASLQCFRETGYRNWYDWNIANWGTKWGAYDYKERSRESGRFVFEFQTAWSIPEPIFVKLTELFPELVFDLITIDEGGPEYESRFSRDNCVIEKKTESNDRYRFVYGSERDAEE